MSQKRVKRQFNRSARHNWRSAQREGRVSRSLSRLSRQLKMSRERRHDVWVANQMGDNA
jgi:hypothetical protein